MSAAPACDSATVQICVEEALSTKASHWLGQFTFLRVMKIAWQTLAEQFGLGVRWLGGMVQLVGFASDYRRFRLLNREGRFALRVKDLYPCLQDRTGFTPLEPIYALQDSWFARKISEEKPSRHVDVGSSARAMMLVAQFVPVTFVDIRPVEIELRGFTFLGGSILALPFPDRSLCSVSSLCVIEHIGLGRYGDPFDAFGSEKAASELRRVLGPGGNLYVSVPIDEECRIYFNAHRAFSREYLLQLFPDLILIEESYIYGRTTSSTYEPQRGFGTGLYHFRRPCE
jgi:Caenorhabditis protein of unknown function, DUF268